jgi:hypothetical protein
MTTPTGSVALTPSLPVDHADGARPGGVAQGGQLARRENGLELRVPTRLPERSDLVVQGSPLPGEHVGARDDDVDLAGSGIKRRADLADPLAQRAQPVGESGRDRRDRDAAPCERLDRGLHEGVVDAYRAHADGQVSGAEGGKQVGPHRLARLAAETDHAAASVVAGERRQVHARHGAQEPRRLPLALHRAPAGQRFSAPLDRAAVDAQAPDPRQVQGRSRVADRAGGGREPGLDGGAALADVDHRVVSGSGRGDDGDVER